MACGTCAALLDQTPGMGAPGTSLSHRLRISCRIAHRISVGSVPSLRRLARMRSARGLSPASRASPSLNTSKRLLALTLASTSAAPA